MTTPLETAFPTAANWVAATVRAKLAEQGVGLFSTAALSGEDFTIQPWAAIAVRGNNGSLEFYAYDSADTTTADDGGVSCIVVSGRRYKKRIDVILSDAAKSATTAAQPGSPTLGDTYILTAAPTGTDWSTQAKKVGTYTARGWIFRAPFVGMVVYVADSDSFYRYTLAGVWAQGLGASGLADGAVPPKKLANPFGMFKVEDQRNAPPGGTPTVGTCYQVGTSPTGSFAGQGNAIARWNASSAWEFFAPAEGDTIYRKDVSTLFSYRSGAWVQAVSDAGIQQIMRRAFSGTFSNVQSTILRDAGITITSKTGRWLRFTFFSLSVIGAGGAPTSTRTYRLGLYADTSTSAITSVSGSATTDSTGPTLTFPTTVLYQVPDNSAHNYNIGIVQTTTGDTTRDFAYDAVMLVEEMVVV